MSASNTGRFSLKVAKNTQIQSVDNWYAYDDNQVFLKKGGGSYPIHLGAPANNVTRITSIPSRGKLVALSGNGTDLDLTFKGKGDMEITLKCAPSSLSVSGGTNRYLFTGANKVKIIFRSDELHAVTKVAPACP